MGSRSLLPWRWCRNFSVTVAPIGVTILAGEARGPPCISYAMENIEEL
jgi:hypothetical protein